MSIRRMPHGPRNQAGIAAPTPFGLWTLTRSLLQRDPLHDWSATVTTCGRVCYRRRKINVSPVFAGQMVGVRQTGDRIWLVTFMDDDLGYFDDETWRFEPIANPFGPKVLPMSPE